MWFQYFDDPTASPIPIDLEDVRLIMEMNAKGEKPDDLQGYAVVEEAAPEDALYGDVVGQDDVKRFDSTVRSGKGGRNRNRRKGRPDQREEKAVTAGGTGEKGPSGQRRKKRRRGKGPDKPSKA
jgi:hypothetical protein